MNLFPDGGFVRLRSRARDRYLHADEDGTGISLRPLGAVPSLDAVQWKVHIWPVEGGDVLLLLQGAAYGRYLAVAAEDEVVPSGYRGVRAYQRNYDSPELDPSFAWRPVRVEAGQNYVRLYNDEQPEQRCLRANGRRHRQWNNVVTVGSRNGDEATMVEWMVEAIPSTPEPLPLPPPPQPSCRDGSCCACGREGSAALCRRCAEQIKDKLLAVAKREMAECSQKKYYYCMECQKIVSGGHKEHQDNSIPLGKLNQKCVAWVGKESWSTIFQAIEAQDRGIRRYHLLYKSEEPRCEVCHDVISTDLLYGVLTPLCSLSCFVAAGGGQETVEKAILMMDTDASPVGFCLTCETAVVGGDVHRHIDHDWLRVRTDSGGLRRVVIPGGHPKEKDWARIKKEGPALNQVLVRDDSSVRCQGCHKRLACAGDS